MDENNKKMDAAEPTATAPMLDADDDEVEVWVVNDDGEIVVM